MPTATRASLGELLDFANRVREAGGGATLHALMPARPADPKLCLIARNLNFDCSVDGGRGPNDEWGMNVHDPVLANRIAEALDLELSPYNSTTILLPEQIGQVARDFDIMWDKSVDALKSLYIDYKWWKDNPKEYFGGDLPDSFEDYVVEAGSDHLLDDVREFWPYVEASLTESEELGFLNENGELIV